MTGTEFDNLLFGADDPLGDLIRRDIGASLPAYDLPSDIMRAVAAAKAQGMPLITGPHETAQQAYQYAQATGGPLAPAQPFANYVASQGPQEGMIRVDPGLAPTVTQCEPKRSGTTSLGFGFSNIAAGASHTFQTTCMVRMKPTRMFLTNGDSALVTQIMVATRSMMNSGDGLPGIMFSEQAVNASINWEIIEPNQLVMITVVNTSGGALDFAIGINGTVVL